MKMGRIYVGINDEGTHLILNRGVTWSDLILKRQHASTFSEGRVWENG